MSTANVGITQTKEKETQRAQPRSSGKMPWLLQITMLAWRSLVVNFRTPGAVLPPLILGGFFLVIYEAQLGNASNFFLTGTEYINFILPLSIISSALSGAGIAGQSIVRDIDNGYFDKLSLTPISRSALILGPTLAGAVVLAIQAAFIILVGVLLGVNPDTGILGLLAVIGYAMLLGLSFAGFTIGVALFTGSPAATQGGNFLFFPLTFLTATFVPIELLDGWIKVAATINPITYILEAMRSIMIDGWVLNTNLQGLLACAVLALITFGFSMAGLRVRTSRK
ncbi:MAG: ABC transporter permease [Chloroflexota bacterium]